MKKAILIVDDETNNIELLSTFLTMTGYSALSAANGKEAIETASKLKPDLIIMDIHLPGIDGLTATELLKKNPDTGHIPIVVVSGYGLPEDKKMASEAGCDEYLTKPFDLAQLRKKISGFFPE